MNGVAIGLRENEFALTPYAPQVVKSDLGSFATYENITVDVQCSAPDFGLIEMSVALKLDVAPEAIPVEQLIYVRCFGLLNDDRLSAKAYDAWYFEEYRKENPNFWRRLQSRLRNRVAELLPPARSATCRVPHRSE